MERWAGGGADTRSWRSAREHRRHIGIALKQERGDRSAIHGILTDDLVLQRAQRRADAVGVHRRQRHPFALRARAHDGAPQCRDTLPGDGDDGNHRHVQTAPELLPGDPDAQCVRLVHHVQGNDERPPQLQKLQRHGEHAGDVLGVDRVDDDVGSDAAVHEQARRHPLVLSRRQQRVDARCVDDLDRHAVEGAMAARDFDRRPRIIRDGDVSSGQAIE